MRYNGSMKRLLFIIYISIISVNVMANDYIVELLDETIIEFSNKNYDRALILVETVLELEPDNETAIMYKQTIEDVIEIDRVVLEEIEESGEVVENTSTQVTSENREEDTSNEEGSAESSNQGLRMKTLLGVHGDDSIVVEQGVRLLFGAPLLDIRLLSNSIEYDLSQFSPSTLPMDEMFDSSNYLISGAIGYRYQTNRSFMDIMLGAGNVSNVSDTVVPFIGFESIFYLWDFTNIWFGSAGRIYSVNSEQVNNYEAEVSSGISILFMELGLWYRYSDFSSIDSSQYSGQSYGLYFAMNL